MIRKNTNRIVGIGFGGWNGEEPYEVICRDSSSGRTRRVDLDEQGVALWT